ncbi:metallophosphoesterase [Beutenbergia cavernae DSM 12333]|uniref:Metallophosphoesterase n=1 Tax=Beutenbergia cavernae (strain ATCC BAA-8 / DSM 12333 / CCUG 43141 / JCM 11478 / NBRC 16432 / NCIMB 13614 / HKI 0122) TaxID=471853 RepID=C5BXX1_BEUC1|nr:metallophosphoesterase [Beutenbergia cavernae DSM 12333]
MGAGVLGWSLLEARRYTLRHVPVPVLSPGARPVRILHLSDLHLVPRQADKRAWLRDLATTGPDVVVDTGDNMAHREALPAVLDALEPLLALPGAFVMGSNDYFAPKIKNPLRYFLDDPRGFGDEGPSGDRLPGKELGAAFRAAGWRDLTNRRDTIDVGGTRLDLVGVDDPHLERDVLPPPVTAPADGGAAPGSSVRIGVAHAPYQRVLRGMQDDGAQLVLAGHTHGGQLCVPGYGALVTNCDLDTRRASGLHGWPGARPDEPGGEGSLWLHVSAGLGTSPYTPVRLACRPEATLVDLVPRDSRRPSAW